MVRGGAGIKEKRGTDENFVGKELGGRILANFYQAGTTTLRRYHINQGFDAIVIRNSPISMAA